jgi:dihydrofolate synthase/folylpolyglutamate synthase
MSPGLVRSLGDWLDYIGRQHAQPIALGLDRVRAVFDRLGVSLAFPVFTVGGTNGKGSTTAMLESILRAAGYRTGLYTSPHLVRYNERVRIAGIEADDASLVDAFEAVERARGEVPLTYFEYGTLAALRIFAGAKLDAAVLEVGLGGRLDAVNVVDADCAVVTSVGIDHVEFLGATREEIGREKAGIFRRDRPAVIADPDPPASLMAVATEVAARPLLLGRDFGFRAKQTQWDYWGPGMRRSGLAYPALRGEIQLRNASAALCALDALRDRLPVTMQEVRRGLAEVTLAARYQVLPGRPSIVLDVAHNPEAARVLSANLGASGFSPEVIAVFSMLRDKDVEGVVREVALRVTRWRVAPSEGPRGMTAAGMAAAVKAAGVDAPVFEHASVEDALRAAREEAGENDKILIFGSFLTVSAALAVLDREAAH